MRTILKQAEPRPVTSFDLECGGVVIGKVEVTPEGRFHVTIKGGPGTGVGNLYQGISASLEEAIMELLDTHRRQALAQLEEIQKLHEMLIG